MQVMLDLETLGTSAGSVILSIGAATFDKTGVGNQSFYAVINLESSLQAGLTTNPDTIAWWSKQSPAAQEVLTEAKMGGMPLDVALNAFATWFRSVPGKPGIWGLGATFDNVLLRAAYEKAGIKCPWHYRSDRCFRTLWALASGIAAERIGVHHNALDDAIFQASVASKILNHLGVM